MHAVDNLVRDRIPAHPPTPSWARRSQAIRLDPVEDRRFGTGLGFGLLLSVPFWIGLAAILLR